MQQPRRRPWPRGTYCRRGRRRHSTTSAYEAATTDRRPVRCAPRLSVSADKPTILTLSALFDAERLAAPGGRHREVLPEAPGEVGLVAKAHRIGDARDPIGRVRQQLAGALHAAGGEPLDEGLAGLLLQQLLEVAR